MTDVVGTRERYATSVVVATHDSDNWDSLAATLASVDLQTVAADSIVVAVDHNPDLARRLGEARPDVIIASNTGEHRGASATRNAGAAACDSSIVVFLDDDEVAEPDWLHLLTAPFDDPNVVGTGGRYVPDWRTPRPGWFPDELAWVVGAHHTGMPVQNAKVRNVWSGNMAVRRSVFDAVGGFRLGFGKVGNRSRPEDTDLCIRMAASKPGSYWMYLPDARIHHAVPPERSSFGFFLRRCYAEGRGKIDIQHAHHDLDALSTERDYLRTTIPIGLQTHARDAMAAAGRAAAIGLGLGAAATGAAVSRVAIAVQKNRR